LIEKRPKSIDYFGHADVSSDDAADVFQEVFMAVATHVAEFRRDRPGDTFLGWLRTITRNKILDHFRRRQGKPMGQGGTGVKETLEQMPDQTPESIAADSLPDDSSSVAQRVAQMVRTSVEDRTWRAFWCLAIEDRKAADVADDLGMNVRAVYESKYRVMRKLREEMSGLIE